MAADSMEHGSTASSGREHCAPFGLGWFARPKHACDRLKTDPPLYDCSTSPRTTVDCPSVNHNCKLTPKGNVRCDDGLFLTRTVADEGVSVWKHDDGYKVVVPRMFIPKENALDIYDEDA